MRTSAKNAILVTLSVSNYCGVDVRMSVRNFFDYYKCPSPQPNIEIRKPNIELKVTLISVTICSLIFFICTSCFVSSQVAISTWINPCGVPNYGKSENYSDMSILSKIEPNSKFEQLHRWISFVHRLRPYHDEHTRSRLITEVKHRRARIVLGWGTAWEHLVP